MINSSLESSAHSSYFTASKNLHLPTRKKNCVHMRLRQKATGDATETHDVANRVDREADILAEYCKQHKPRLAQQYAVTHKDAVRVLQEHQPPELTLFLKKIGAAVKNYDEKLAAIQEGMPNFTLAHDSPATCRVLQAFIALTKKERELVLHELRENAALLGEVSNVIQQCEDLLQSFPKSKAAFDMCLCFGVKNNRARLAIIAALQKKYARQKKLLEKCKNTVAPVEAFLEKFIETIGRERARQILSHLCDDSDISNTGRILEGGNSGTAIAFLLPMLRLFAQRSGTDAAALQKPIDQFAQLQEYCDVPDARKTAWVMKKLQKLGVGQQMLLPAGWHDRTARTGHGVLLEFCKITRNSWSITIYNSGDGLLYHQSVLDPTGKRKYLVSLTYTDIPDASISKQFISEIVEFAVSEKEGGANKFYELIAGSGGREIVYEVAELLKLYNAGKCATAQRAGTCSLSQFIKAYLHLTLEIRLFKRFKKFLQIEYMKAYTFCSGLDFPTDYSLLLQSCKKFRDSLKKHPDSIPFIQYSQEAELIENSASQHLNAALPPPVTIRVSDVPVTQVKKLGGGIKINSLANDAENILRHTTPFKTLSDEEKKACMRGLRTATDMNLPSGLQSFIQYLKKIEDPTEVEAILRAFFIYSADTGSPSWYSIQRDIAPAVVAKISDLISLYASLEGQMIDPKTKRETVLLMRRYVGWIFDDRITGNIHDHANETIPDITDTALKTLFERIQNNSAQAIDLLLEYMNDVARRSEKPEELELFLRHVFAWQPYYKHLEGEISDEQFYEYLKKIDIFHLRVAKLFTKPFLTFVPFTPTNRPDIDSLLHDPVNGIREMIAYAEKNQRAEQRRDVEVVLNEFLLRLPTAGSDFWNTIDTSQIPHLIASIQKLNTLYAQATLQRTRISSDATVCTVAALNYARIDQLARRYPKLSALKTAIPDYELVATAMQRLGALRVFEPQISQQLSHVRDYFVTIKKTATQSHLFSYTRTEGDIVGRLSRKAEYAFLSHILPESIHGNELHRKIGELLGDTTPCDASVPAEYYLWRKSWFLVERLFTENIPSTTTKDDPKVSNRCVWDPNKPEKCFRPYKLSQNGVMIEHERSPIEPIQYQIYQENIPSVLGCIPPGEHHRNESRDTLDLAPTYPRSIPNIPEMSLLDRQRFTQLFQYDKAVILFDLLQFFHDYRFIPARQSAEAKDYSMQTLIESILFHADTLQTTLENNREFRSQLGAWILGGKRYFYSIEDWDTSTFFLSLETQLLKYFPAEPSSQIRDDLTRMLERTPMPPALRARCQFLKALTFLDITNAKESQQFLQAYSEGHQYTGECRFKEHPSFEELLRATRERAYQLLPKLQLFSIAPELVRQRLQVTSGAVAGRFPHYSCGEHSWDIINDTVVKNGSELIQLPDYVREHEDVIKVFGRNPLDALRVCDPDGETYFVEHKGCQYKIVWRDKCLTIFRHIHGEYCAFNLQEQFRWDSDRDYEELRKIFTNDALHSFWTSAKKSFIHGEEDKYEIQINENAEVTAIIKKETNPHGVVEELFLLDVCENPFSQRLRNLAKRSAAPFCVNHWARKLPNGQMELTQITMPQLDIQFNIHDGKAFLDKTTFFIAETQPGIGSRQNCLFLKNDQEQVKVLMLSSIQGEIDDQRPLPVSIKFSAPWTTYGKDAYHLFDYNEQHGKLVPTTPEEYLSLISLFLWSDNLAMADTYLQRFVAHCPGKLPIEKCNDSILSLVSAAPRHIAFQLRIAHALIRAYDPCQKWEELSPKAQQLVYTLYNKIRRLYETYSLYPTLHAETQLSDFPTYAPDLLQELELLLWMTNNYGMPECVQQRFMTLHDSACPSPINNDLLDNLPVLTEQITAPSTAFDIAAAQKIPIVLPAIVLPKYKTRSHTTQVLAEAGRVAQSLQTRKNELRCRVEQLLQSVPHGSPEVAEWTYRNSRTQYRAPTLNLEYAITLCMHNDLDQVRKANCCLALEQNASTRQEIYQAVFEYLFVATEEQHIIRALEKRDITALEAKRHYESTDQHAFLFALIEYAAEVRLWKNQSEMLTSIVQGSGRIEQLVMGSGKTSIIAAVLAQFFADGNSLPILFQPASLYTDVMSKMKVQLEKVFHQELEPLDFSMNHNIDSIFVPSFRLYKLLQRQIQKRCPLIATPKVVQDIWIAYQQQLEYLSRASRDRSVIKKNVQCLEAILRLLKTRGVGILDEVDTLLDRKNVRMLATGAFEQLPHDRFILCRKIFEIIQETKPDLQFANEAEYTQEKPHIARALSRTYLFPEVTGPELDSWVSYLIDERASKPKAFDGLSDTQKANIAAARGMLTKFLSDALTLSCGLHFGFSRVDPSREIAIPYNNTEPAEGFQFESYKTLLVTMKALLHEGLSIARVRTWVQNIKNEEQKVNAQVRQGNTDGVEAYLATKKGLYDVLQRLTPELARKDLFRLNEADVAVIQQAIQHDRAAIWAYAERHVLPHVGTYVQAFSSNGYSFIEQLHKFVGFSGTLPWGKNNHSMHPGVDLHPDENVLRQGECVLNRDETQVLSVRTDVPFAALCDRLVNEYHLDNYHALIDEGAWFKGVGNLRVAEELLRRLPHTTGIIFYGDGNQRIFLRSGENLLLTEYQNRNNVLQETVFAYYDKAHCVGADISLPEAAKGFVTMNQFTTISSLLQAIFRMRRVAERQVVHIGVPESLGTGLHTGAQIFAHCSNVEQAKIRNDNYLAFQQYLREKVKIARTDDMLRAPTARAKLDIWEANRPHFITERTENPLKEFADPDVSMRARDACIQQRENLRDSLPAADPLRQQVNETAILSCELLPQHEVYLHGKDVDTQQEIQVQTQLKTQTQQEESPPIERAHIRWQKSMPIGTSEFFAHSPSEVANPCKVPLMQSKQLTEVPEFRTFANGIYLSPNFTGAVLNLFDRGQPLVDWVLIGEIAKDKYDLYCLTHYDATEVARLLQANDCDDVPVCLYNLQSGTLGTRSRQNQIELRTIQSSEPLQLMFAQLKLFNGVANFTTAEFTALTAWWNLLSHVDKADFIEALNQKILKRHSELAPAFESSRARRLLTLG